MSNSRFLYQALLEVRLDSEYYIFSDLDLLNSSKQSGGPSAQKGILYIIVILILTLDPVPTPFRVKVSAGLNTLPNGMQRSSLLLTIQTSDRIFKTKIELSPSADGNLFYFLFSYVYFSCSYKASNSK